MPLDEYIARRPEHPWLAEFEADPDSRFDEVVRGVALIQPYGLADAQTLLPLLFDPLDPADPLLGKLDAAASRWLERTRRIPPEQRRRYGFKRYWRDVTEALAVVQMLPLGKSRTLLRDEYFDFLRWVGGQKPFGSANDPRVRFWYALAEDQPDSRLGRLWSRICREVGAGVLPDYYLGAALSGLSNLPGTAEERVRHLLAGLAGWGAELTETKANRHDFAEQFQALMWTHLRAGRAAWRPLVEPILRNYEYRGKPFVGWWAELLSIKNLDKANPAVREPVIRDVLALVSRIQMGRQPLDDLQPEIRKLMNERRSWAEVTGDSSHLWLTASNIGARVVEKAPKLALELVTEALDWAPHNVVLWNLWGRALVNLGRRNLAEAVFWEASRRFPQNEPTLVELARLLAGRGRNEEALAIFRDAVNRFPKNEQSHVELSRLLAALGRAEQARTALERAAVRFPDNGQTQVEVARLRAGLGDLPSALSGLRRYVDRHPNNGIAINILGQLLIHDGQADAAREELARLEEMGGRFQTKQLRSSLAKFERNGAVPIYQPDYSIDLPPEKVETDQRWSGGEEVLLREAKVTRADRQLANVVSKDISENRRRELAEIIADEPDHGYARLVWADRVGTDAEASSGLLADFPRWYELRLTVALGHRNTGELARIEAEFKERAALTKLAAIALDAADAGTVLAVAKWLLREAPPAADLALHHTHGAVWKALTAARNTPRDQDAIADDLPAIRDTLAVILRQALRMACALPIAA